MGNSKMISNTVITLNMNGFNTIFKRQKLSDQFYKTERKTQKNAVQYIERKMLTTIGKVHFY